ncbi:DNA adenine methylase [Lysinibacillus sp. NPDC093712]|uniref:DNA adenine methylase n=1 Tax=Lysinibacillus sp. NPDC093712 TaxID=3390579 RepID=UPI003D00B470
MYLLKAENCFSPKQTLIDEYNKLHKVISGYSIHDISKQHLIYNARLKELGEILQINHKQFTASRFMCEFCSEVYPAHERLDHNEEGYWCDSCDCFNYFSNARSAKDRFILILEDATAPAVHIPKDIKRKLSAQLSPLRYPGGKSKLVQYLFSHIQKSKRDVLYSPFAGGASFEFALLHAEAINHLHLNDLDFGIHSLYWTILNMPSELIYRVNNILPTRTDYFKAQQNIRNGFKGMNMLEAAWDTLVVNRLAYSGIPKANPLGGKKGTQDQLLSRWNPKSLSARIQSLANLADKITLYCEDAYGFVEEAYWNTDAHIFLDPPYVKKGQALYNHFYTEQDHTKLAFLLNELYKGMPGADIIVTYDLDKLITDSYEHQTEAHIIGRRYSI